MTSPDKPWISQAGLHALEAILEQLHGPQHPDVAAALHAIAALKDTFVEAGMHVMNSPAGDARPSRRGSGTFMAELLPSGRRRKGARRLRSLILR